jgi:hypothetical protein
MNASFPKILLLAAAVFPVAVASVAGKPAGGKNDEPAKLAAQGESFLAKGRVVEALGLLRQAAKAGNVSGAFGAGDILLDQARNSSGRERILKSSESFGYLFFAATNRQPQACAELSDALQNGIGVQTNLAAAYAWLKVAAGFDPSFQAKLDPLAMRITPDEICRGQDLARQWQLGHWPANTVRRVDDTDPRLKVQGTATSNGRSLVILNDTIFGPGDTNEIYPANGPKRTASGRLIATCLEIGNDYVLVSIAGESRLKLLSIGTLSSN